MLSFVTLKLSVDVQQFISDMCHFDSKSYFKKWKYICFNIVIKFTDVIHDASYI
jgi:hypothetical protein